jgi:hypothetical protein
MLANAGHSYRWQNPLGQIGPGIALVGILAVVGIGSVSVKKIIGRKVVK